MTGARCPLCGSPEIPFFYEEGGFRYRRCRRCRLVFLRPLPGRDFLEAHYQGYLETTEAGERAWGREMEPVVRAAADALSGMFPAPGRLLDVGCGYGFFLAEMQRRGWEVEGLELSKGAAELARRRTGAPVRSLSVEAAEFPAAFDVVTLFYVIEHLPDPISVLRKIRGVLRPGGVLLLRYPNTAPLIRLVGPRLARRLRLMQAPSHLYDFSAAAMDRMLRMAGFAETRTTLLGNTRPRRLVSRLVSCYIGGLAERAARWTGGRLLLPGVSRVTFASGAPGRLPRPRSRRRL